jgi:ribosomal protein S12 methylthiotransferase
LIDGPSEDIADLLEARHEGLGPEIDGVVYIGKEGGRPGDFVQVVINDAVGYDLVAGRHKSQGPVEPSLLHPSKTNRGYR